MPMRSDRGRGQQRERHRNDGREHAAAACRRKEKPCRHRVRRTAHVSSGCKPPQGGVWLQLFVKKSCKPHSDWIATSLGKMPSQPEHAHYRWAVQGKSAKKPCGYLLGQPGEGTAFQRGVLAKTVPYCFCSACAVASQSSSW